MDRALLIQQNQKLASNLEEKRRECKQLEGKLVQYEAREKDYTCTVLCVRRLWEQLNDDIAHLCTGLVPDTGLPGSIKREDDDAEAPQAADPFLARLLAGADVSTKESVQAACEQISDETVNDTVEKGLQARSLVTKQALARLLDAVRQLQSRAGAAPDAGAASSPPVLMQQLDASHAERRMLQERVRQVSDHLLEAKQRIRQLEEEAADQQQALNNVQRKLHNLQKNSPLPAPLADAPQDAERAAQRAGSGVIAADMDEDTSELLAKRTAELEQEQEAHMQTKRELVELHARLNEDSSWVQNTRAYQALAAQLAALQEAAAAHAREMELLASEKEAAHARAADRDMIAMREAQLAARSAELTARFQAMCAAKTESDAARAEAEAALLRARQRYEGSSTATELRNLVAMLQSQLAVKEQQLVQARVPAERIEACTQEHVQARSAVTLAQLARDEAVQHAAQLKSQVQEGKKQKAAIEDRLYDMQAFVDVLTAYCPDSAAEQLAGAQSQVAVLQARCKTLQAQLDSFQANGMLEAAHSNEAEMTERLAKARTEVHTAQAELAAGKAQLEEVNRQLTAARAECQLYAREIEVTSKTFQEVQGQNSRLTAALADKEEAAGSLSAEKLKLEAVVQRLEEGISLLQAEVQALKKQLADAVALREAAERELARLAAEKHQVMEQLRIQGLRAAGFEAEVKRREEAAALLSSQLEASTRNVATLNNKLLEETEKGQRDRNKRQRLEEENKLLSTKLAKVRKTQGGGFAGGAKELSEEVEAMRKLLNCSVCHERQKNVIITKCCHVFCRECIKRNLDTRNRKCPGCGIAFGQADVRNFFFT